MSRVASLLLIVLLGVSVPGAAADASLRREITSALKEKDDDARALALERALSGADGVAAATLILDRVVAKPKSELERSIGARALANMAEPEAVALIGRVAVETGDLAVRAAAIEVLGDQRTAGTVGALQTAARDPDARVRAAALTALGRRDDEDHDLVLAEGLLDADWRVRSAAIWGLVDGGRLSAVPLLTNRMRHEGGRLIDDLTAALTDLTGERFGPSPLRYETWWREQQENGTERGPPTTDAGWDPPAPTIDAPLLTSRSERVLFVLSTGDSMKEEVRVPTLSDGQRLKLMAAGEDLAADYDEAETKLELARVHLRAMLRSLRDGVQFDVATYAASPAFAFGKPTKAGTATRKKAEARIARLSPGGGSNLSGLLTRAFDPKAKDPIGAAPTYDTIVLLSDGRLAAPGSTSRPEVIARVRRWSRVRQVRFIVIPVGISDDAVLGPLASGPPRGVVRSIP